jgi:hypothetical protein
MLQGSTCVVGMWGLGNSRGRRNQARRLHGRRIGAVASLTALVVVVAVSDGTSRQPVWEVTAAAAIGRRRLWWMMLPFSP